jgi:hypothetical protein
MADHRSTGRGDNVAPVSDRPERLHGWLLLLSRLLIVAQPLRMAVIASRALNAIAVRGPAVLYVLTLRLLVTALGIAAGLALTNRRPGALGLTRLAILTAAATDTFVYTTPYFPNNLAPGDTPLVLGAWLTFYAAWVLYLARSRQVSDTFT